MSIYAEPSLAKRVPGLISMSIVRAARDVELSIEQFKKAVQRTEWTPLMVGDLEGKVIDEIGNPGGAERLAGIGLNFLQAISQEHAKPLLYGGPIFQCMTSLLGKWKPLLAESFGACYTVDRSWLRTMGALSGQLNLYGQVCGLAGISPRRVWICLHPYGKEPSLSLEKQAWLLSAAKMIQRRGMNILLVSPSDLDPSPWVEIARVILEESC